MSASNPSSSATTEASTTNDAASLTKAALAVQDGLRNIRPGLEKVDAFSRTQILPLLVDLDEKYRKLLNESHFAAHILKSKVRDFLESFVPVSQNEQDSLSEAFTDVKEAADKISSIAQEGFNPCAKLISSVTEDTMGLGATVVAANALLKKEVKQILPDLKLEIDILVQDMESNHELLYRLGEKNQQEIASLTTETTNTDMTPTKIDSLPLKTSAEAMKIFSAIRRISDFFGGEAAFKENQQALGRKAIELGELEKAIEERSVKVESTLIENYALLDEISQLVDKIEGFGAMLEKLVSDTTALSKYCAERAEHSGVDGKELNDRIQLEAEIYARIAVALDDYCLRV